VLFPTFDFLIFAIPVFIGFWLLAEKPVARVLFLLVASYFFYTAGPQTTPPPAPWTFVGLLLFSTVLDFVCGRQIHSRSAQAKSEYEEVRSVGIRLRRRWMAASLVGNLGLLGYFKYANFFLQGFADLLGVTGIETMPYHLDVVMPLGISFYTFQSLSYTLDIFRGRLNPEPSFTRFALFVVFFPQLVAGPIVRATQFLPQLHRGPQFSRENFEVGAFRICRGLVKKVVLGDWIAVQLTDAIFGNPTTFTSTELMIALYAYTLQIYADFSGYSDMAIGVARMLGFTLPENFDRPYQSRDIAEYWRRWHMTLSTWLRDYLFFTLLAKLGARGGYVAVWVTMFLVGMWHGASWNFVIYANIHAGAVVFNRWNRMRKRERPSARAAWQWSLACVLVATLFAALGRSVLTLEWATACTLGGLLALAFVITSFLPQGNGKLHTAAHIATTFHLLVFSRIFFRAPDLETARSYIEGLLSFETLAIRPGLVSGWVGAALAFGLVYHFTPKQWVNTYALALFRRTPGIVLGATFTALLYLLMLLRDGQPRAFIYFQF